MSSAFEQSIPLSFQEKVLENIQIQQVKNLKSSFAFFINVQFRTKIKLFHKNNVNWLLTNLL